MQVRMLVDHKGRTKGDEFGLRDEIAKSWISRGFAEDANNPKPKAKSRSTRRVADAPIGEDD